MTLKTLNIDDDMAEEVVAEVENAFALRFTADETAQVITVGDLHTLLAMRLRRSDGACATSMAFYRLRRALLQLTDVQRIKTDTRLATFAVRSPRRFLRRIERLSGLRGLSGTPGALGITAAWIGMAGFFGLVLSLVARSPWVFGAGVGGVALAFALGWLDRGRFPRGVAMVGDLARYAVARNHGSLILQGAAVRDDETWTSVQRLVAELLGARVEVIGRDTTFFKAAKRAA